MTSTVTPAVSRNASIWLKAFWPTVASSTSTTSCGAVGSSLPSTRFTLASSSINSCLFCSRPAVSMISTSTRSEEHTSELQSLMRISYAVFCLKKKNKQTTHEQENTQKVTDNRRRSN